jgi:hypothetical protein
MMGILAALHKPISGQCPDSEAHMVSRRRLPEIRNRSRLACDRTRVHTGGRPSGRSPVSLQIGCRAIEPAGTQAASLPDALAT